ncbi:MAG TPA: hypothetical protein VFZ47_04560 [Chitinophagaceae bacterium]
MKSPVLMTFVLVLALSACQDQAKQQQQKEEPPSTKAYIPVADFIETEIRMVRNASAGILKREIYKDRSDSAFIKPEEFEALAQAFRPAELEHDRFEKSFTESSFLDQTPPETLAFTYESTDSTSNVKRVDVLASPSLGLDKFKSVYIERSFTSGDTAVEQKMTWKAGKSFQVITMKSLPGASPEVHQLKVIWDPFSYQE